MTDNYPKTHNMRTSLSLVSSGLVYWKGIRQKVDDSRPGHISSHCQEREKEHKDISLPVNCYVCLKDRAFKNLPRTFYSLLFTISQQPQKSLWEGSFNSPHLCNGLVQLVFTLQEEVIKWSIQDRVQLESQGKIINTRPVGEI